MSWNRRALLRRCLEALELSDEREALDPIVVDNGSTDGSAELEAEFPNVRFIRLPRNFGLTKAVNIGVRATEGEHVLLLHDDTFVASNTVSDLAAALDSDADAAAVCPLLLDDQARPAPQVSKLPPDVEFRPADPDAPIEYASGAALMVRSFFIKGFRHIDERYGQYGSDAEVCYQIRNARRGIRLVPAATAVHIGNAEVTSLRRADFKQGIAAFMAKHRGFAAGLKFRAGAVFQALGGFRMGELMHLLTGQKIDGTQRD